jgi:hypothetical protein
MTCGAALILGGRRRHGCRLSTKPAAGAVSPGRVGERFLILIWSAAGYALRSLLADNTQSGPWHGSQAFCGNLLFTVEANAEAAVFDTL